MSVKSILDPTTGLVSSNYLPTTSTSQYKSILTTTSKQNAPEGASITTQANSASITIGNILFPQQWLSQYPYIKCTTMFKIFLSTINNPTNPPPLLFPVQYTFNNSAGTPNFEIYNGTGEAPVYATINLNVNSVTNDAYGEQVIEDFISTNGVTSNTLTSIMNLQLPASAGSMSLQGYSYEVIRILTPCSYS